MITNHFLLLWMIIFDFAYVVSDFCTLPFELDKQPLNSDPVRGDQQCLQDARLHEDMPHSSELLQYLCSKEPNFEYTIDLKQPSVVSAFIFKAPHGCPECLPNIFQTAIHCDDAISNEKFSQGPVQVANGEKQQLERNVSTSFFEFVIENSSGRAMIAKIELFGCPYWQKAVSVGLSRSHLNNVKLSQPYARLNTSLLFGWLPNVTNAEPTVYLRVTFPQQMAIIIMQMQQQLTTDHQNYTNVFVGYLSHYCQRFVYYTGKKFVNPCIGTEERKLLKFDFCTQSNEIVFYAFAHPLQTTDLFVYPWLSEQNNPPTFKFEFYTWQSEEPSHYWPLSWDVKDQIGQRDLKYMKTQLPCSIKPCKSDDPFSVEFTLKTSGRIYAPYFERSPNEVIYSSTCSESSGYSQDEQQVVLHFPSIEINPSIQVIVEAGVWLNTGDIEVHSDRVKIQVQLQSHLAECQSFSSDDDPIVRLFRENDEGKNSTYFKMTEHFTNLLAKQYERLPTIDLLIVITQLYTNVSFPIRTPDNWRFEYTYFQQGCGAYEENIMVKEAQDQSSPTPRNCTATADGYLCNFEIILNRPLYFTMIKLYEAPSESFTNKFMIYYALKDCDIKESYREISIITRKSSKEEYISLVQPVFANCLFIKELDFHGNNRHLEMAVVECIPGKSEDFKHYADIPTDDLKQVLLAGDTVYAVFGNLSRPTQKGTRLTSITYDSQSNLNQVGSRLRYDDTNVYYLKENGDVRLLHDDSFVYRVCDDFVIRGGQIYCWNDNKFYDNGMQKPYFLDPGMKIKNFDVVNDTQQYIIEEGTNKLYFLSLSELVPVYLNKKCSEIKYLGAERLLWCLTEDGYLETMVETMVWRPALKSVKCQNFDIDETRIVCVQRDGALKKMTRKELPHQIHIPLFSTGYQEAVPFWGTGIGLSASLLPNKRLSVKLQTETSYYKFPEFRPCWPQCEVFIEFDSSLLKLYVDKQLRYIAECFKKSAIAVEWQKGLVVSRRFEMTRSNNHHLIKNLKIWNRRASFDEIHSKMLLDFETMEVEEKDDYSVTSTCGLTHQCHKKGFEHFQFSGQTCLSWTEAWLRCTVSNAQLLSFDELSEMNNLSPACGNFLVHVNGTTPATYNRCPMFNSHTGQLQEGDCATNAQFFCKATGYASQTVLQPTISQRTTTCGEQFIYEPNVAPFSLARSEVQKVMFSFSLSSSEIHGRFVDSAYLKLFLSQKPSIDLHLKLTLSDQICEEGVKTSRRIVKWTVFQTTYEDFLWRLSPNLAESINGYLEDHHQELDFILYWHQVYDMSISNISLFINYQDANRFVKFKASKGNLPAPFYESTAFTTFDTTFSFSYYMRGHTMLCVWIYYDQVYELKFVLRGDQGDSWKNASFSSASKKLPTSFIFLAIMEDENDEKVLAIDDISSSELSQSSGSNHHAYSTHLSLEERYLQRMEVLPECVVSFAQSSACSILEFPERNSYQRYGVNKYGMPGHALWTMTELNSNRRVLLDYESFTILFTFKITHVHNSTYWWLFYLGQADFGIFTNKTRKLYLKSRHLEAEEIAELNINTWIYFSFSFDGKKEYASVYINNELKHNKVHKTMFQRPLFGNLVIFNGIKPEEESAISCLQIYSQTLTLSQIKAAEKCPSEISPEVCKERCVDGGICGALKCKCPNHVLRYYDKNTCALNLRRRLLYQAASSFYDFDDSPMPPNRLPKTPVNRGRCFLGKIPLHLRGDSFTLSSWIKILSGTIILAVQNFTVETTVLNEGVVSWFNENATCQLNATIPRRVWFFMNLQITRGMVSLQINDDQIRQVFNGCPYNTFAADSLTFSSGMCVDEILYYTDILLPSPYKDLYMRPNSSAEWLAVASEFSTTNIVNGEHVLKAMSNVGKNFSLSFEMKLLKSTEEAKNIMSIGDIRVVYYPSNPEVIYVKNSVSGHVDSIRIKKHEWGRLNIQQRLFDYRLMSYRVNYNNQTIATHYHEKKINNKQVHVVLAPEPSVQYAYFKNYHQQQPASFFNVPEEVAFVRDNLITTLPQLKKSFSVSFQVRHTSKHLTWTNLIHLSTGGDFGSIGTRVPSVYLLNGRLHVQGHVNDQPNFSTDCGELPLHVWNSVKIYQQKIQTNDDYEFSVIVNDEVCKKVINITPMEFRDVKVYVSDPWYKPTIGFIKDFQITGGSQITGILWVAEERPFVNDNILTTLPELKKEFSISFQIKPTSENGQWSNIIHVTTEGDKYEFGTRLPAVFVQNGVLSVYAYITQESTTQDYYPKFVFECGKLQLNEWSAVKIYQQKKWNEDYHRFVVNVNGGNCGEKINNDAKSFGNVKVYVSDRWYDAMPGFIKDLQIFETDNEFAARRNNLVRIIPELDTFEIDFQIYPIKMYEDYSWQSIIYLTTGGTYNDAEFILGVWMQNTRIYVYGKDDNRKFNNEDKDPVSIPLNKWTTINVRQYKHHSYKRLEVKIGDNTILEVDTTSGKRFENVKVYMGDPWYEPVYGWIRELSISGDDPTFNEIYEASGELPIIQGQLVKKIPLLRKDFNITFKVKPIDYFSGKIQSVIYLSNKENSDGSGNHIPAFFIKENENLRFSFHMSDDFDFKKDVGMKLPLKKWTSVTIRQSLYDNKYWFKVEVNGVEKANKFNDHARDFSDVKVYLGNPKDLPLNGFIKDLTIYSGIGGGVVDLRANSISENYRYSLLDNFDNFEVGIDLKLDDHIPTITNFLSLNSNAGSLLSVWRDTSRMHVTVYNNHTAWLFDDSTAIPYEEAYHRISMIQECTDVCRVNVRLNGSLVLEGVQVNDTIEGDLKLLTAHGSVIPGRVKNFVLTSDGKVYTIDENEELPVTFFPKLEIMLSSRDFAISSEEQITGSQYTYMKRLFLSVAERANISFNYSLQDIRMSSGRDAVEAVLHIQLGAFVETEVVDSLPTHESFITYLDRKYILTYSKMSHVTPIKTDIEAMLFDNTTIHLVVKNHMLVNANPNHRGYHVSVKVYYINSTLLYANASYIRYPIDDTLVLSNCTGYRDYRITVRPMYHQGYGGKTVVPPLRTGWSVNKLPPIITNLTLHRREISLSLEFNDKESPNFFFRIYYADISTYINETLIFEDLEEFWLLDYIQSANSTVVITDLKPYRYYKMFVAVINDNGRWGNITSAINKTLTDVPDTVSNYTIELDGLNVTAAASPLQITSINAPLPVYYRALIEPYFNHTGSEQVCPAVVIYNRSHPYFNFTGVCTHKQVVKLSVRAINEVGCSLPHYLCFVTTHKVSETVAQIFNMEHLNLAGSPEPLAAVNATFGDSDPMSEHFIVDHYKVVVVNHSTNIVPLQHDTEDIEIWNSTSLFNCTHAQNLTKTSKNVTLFVEHLLYFHNYTFQIFSCHWRKCSSDFAQVTIETPQHESTCVLDNINYNVTAFTFNLTFEAPSPNCINAFFVNYSIAYFETSKFPNVTVENATHVRSFNEVQYSSVESFNVTGLEAYWNYTVYLFVVNNVGDGVLSQPIIITTAEYVPTGYPQNFSVVLVGQTDADLQWDEIPPIQQNGVITRYLIYGGDYRWEVIPDESPDRMPGHARNYTFTTIPFRKHVYQICGCNRLGCGPRANLTFLSKQLPPFSAPQVTTTYDVSTTEISVEWVDLPSQDVHGYLHYKVFSRRLPSNEVDAVNTTDLQVTLKDLQSYTNYSIEVCGCTDGGCGPCSSNIQSTSYYADGNWGTWSDWGQCDRSCGLGKQLRLRWCTNPIPFHGKDCQGSNAETRDCNDFPCLGYYLALPSQSCADTCEHSSFLCSTRIVARNINFTDLRDPLDHRNTVSLPSCSEQQTSKVYKQAYDPSYSLETNECQGYNNVVGFSCKAKADKNTKRICLCVDEGSQKFAEWAAWGLECTKSCGAGTKQRFRECLLKEGCGNEPTFQLKQCNIHACPINGGWGLWSEFSACSTTCGMGKRTRRRKCDNPLANFGGKECRGASEDLITGCNPQPCPVHGEWGSWGGLAECTQPCGGNGHRVERRFCDSPRPRLGGNGCAGAGVLVQPCDYNRPCKEAGIEFVIRFTEEKWRYQMWRIRHPYAVNVTNKIKENILGFYDEKSKDLSLEGMLEFTFIKLRRGSVVARFKITYPQIPFNELLELQATLDGDGYIKDMPASLLSISSGSVPSLPPENVTVVSTSPYSFHISWLPPHRASVNGQLYLYYVFYKPAFTNQTYEKNAGSTKLWLDLRVKPAVAYSIRVLASNLYGNGVASKEIISLSSESAPKIAPPNCMYTIMAFDTVFFTWDFILQSFIPGILVGYNVTIRKYTDNTLQTKLAYSNFNSVKFTGLEGAQTYFVEIAGYTSAGLGPTYTTVIKMPEGPPAIAPPNATVFDKMSWNELQLSWDFIPSRKENGRLLGYHIWYAQTSQSDVDLVSEDWKLVTCDRYTNELVVKDLSNYARYSFRISAFTKVGDGPQVLLSAETCRCPGSLFTNWLHYEPFIHENEHAEVIGFFREFLSQALREICSTCHGYENHEVSFTRTQDGRNAGKRTRNAFLNAITNLVHLSFPLSRKDKVYAGYPFLEIVPSLGSAVLAHIPDRGQISFEGVWRAIAVTWSILVLSAFFSLVFALLIWFTEQASTESDFERESLVKGVGQGLWFIFVTMTTVGYGDVLVKTTLGRILSMTFILGGLVITSIFVGSITSTIYSTDMTKNDKTLYGNKLATIEQSNEYYMAIRKNAHVISGNFSTLEALVGALRNGRAERVLVDVALLMGKEEWLREQRAFLVDIMKVGNSHGVVLTAEMTKLELEMTSYIKTNQVALMEYTDKLYEGLVLPIYKKKESLISAGELKAIFTKLGITFGFLYLLCVLFTLIQTCLKKKQKIHFQDGARYHQLKQLNLANRIEAMKAKLLDVSTELTCSNETELKELALLKKSLSRHIKYVEHVEDTRVIGAIFAEFSK